MAGTKLGSARTQEAAALSFIVQRMGDLTSMLIPPDPIWMVMFYATSSQITLPSVMAAEMQVELGDRILVRSRDNKMLLNVTVGV